jgi:hypothetical protein
MKKLIILTFLGLLLLVSGITLIIIDQPLQTPNRILLYGMVIIGSLIFGDNIGKIVVFKVLKGNPSLAKTIKIEKNDERNIIISNRAKAKAFDIMTGPVTAAIILVLVLTKSNSWDIHIVCCLHSAFLLFKLFYFSKYQKEM